MLKLFNHKRKSLLGLDISSSAIKLLELSEKDDRINVDAYAVELLPGHVSEAKNLKDPAAITASIRRLLDKSKTKTRQAAIAVPDGSVINRVIQLDADLNDGDMEEMVYLEADKFIPYPIDEVNLDYDVLGPSAKDASLVDVLMVASRSENVNAYVDAVQQAGLEVKIVDVESYDVERACSLISDDLPKQGQDSTIAIIDIGAIVTNLTVLHNLSTIFSREEMFGGEQLTEEIVKRYDLTTEEASRAKRSGVLPDDYPSDVLMPFIDTAVLQVRRSLQFFFSSSQHASVDHIILGGGTAQLPGLVSLIEEHVQIPVTLGNPLRKMSVARHIDIKALANDAPSMMIACGLAMRKFY